MSATRSAARRKRYERRLRNRVARERGCLGSLPDTTRRLLSLRAGLHGPPLSRSDAASELGLTRRSAARLERSGLRELHVVCGGGTSAPAAGVGSGGGTQPRFVSLVSGAPELQPVTSLASETTVSSSDGAAPRGSQDVKGVTSTAPPAAGASNPVSAAVQSERLTADASRGGNLPLLIAFILAGLAALALVALRRQGVVNQRGAAASPGASRLTQATATAEPARSQAAPAPPPPAAFPAAASAVAASPAFEWTKRASDRAATESAPSEQPDSAPADNDTETSADAGKTAVRPQPPRPQAAATRERIVRTASTVAAGAVSLAVREIRRRRGKR